MSLQVSVSVKYSNENILLNQFSALVVPRPSSSLPKLSLLKSDTKYIM